MRLIFFNIGQMDDALKYFKISEKLFSDAIPTTNVLMNTDIERINTFVKHNMNKLSILILMMMV